MLSGDRIWQILPGFLKRTKMLMYDVCRAAGAALDEIITAAEKLKAQGMINRLVGFDDYYASDERKRDLNLHGASRFVFKMPGESWEDFETRLQQFAEDVKWYGTKRGITTEIERTGLVVDSLEEMRDDPYRFILLSLADQCGVAEDQISHVFALGEENESVRDARMFGLQDCENFVFIVDLSGSTSYSIHEVKTILKLTKPPYTKAYVFFPGQSVAEEVI